ncbi:cytochrome ubiquinol oxidase subunit I [Saccharicrinis sp. FJH2]|uniref:cytochrome ubiquinol oxidase subunit I n=1 Tax=Saccharicrinis sp. FJH65 TaxID=3344659 RepID=UPI0035F2E13E
MNYPIWYLPNIGGGLLIAIIAILHVVVAHLAVGGGLFLVMTERKAIKSNDSGMLQYVKKHTSFFMLLTMVFGGVSGVGIWFIISLVNPGATSALIHNFVFGWAIEWVFFIGEIVALLIYHYRFDKMHPKNHMIIGWLYFIFAWLSLFIINGILGFMLTPGRWIETGSFWLGFFNPSFLPGLLFRTAIAVTFAGVFALVTGSFLKDKELRTRVFRYSAKWMYIPLVILALTGFYYSTVISEESFRNLFHVNPESRVFISLLIYASIALFGLGLLTIVKMNSFLQKLLAFALVIISLGWMSGFEYMREIARKPYVLYDYMYSNGIHPEDIPEINETGFLASAKWSKIKEVTNDNKLQAGAEIFRIQCMSCHTIDNYNGIKSRTNRLTERGLVAQLTGMGKVNTYMPPFVGTEKEKDALAAYIYEDIQGKTTSVSKPYIPTPLTTEVPPFDPKKDEYVLLVWNDLGMHCISDDEKYFSFLPPANTLNAQLFKRGAVPQVVTEGVELLYEAEPMHAHPEKTHPSFWEYSKEIFGVDIPLGKGLAGKTVKDTMDVHGNHFAADFIPVVPYREDNIYSPYPMFTIRAIDKNTGELLVTTKAVTPTSTEMGCKNCHGGDFAWNGISGVSNETSRNILAAHDRHNGTTLLADAENGHPKLCQSCHADPAVGAKGQDGILNFSSAVHGFHANYLANMDNTSCNMCHPSATTGNTNCYRGRHTETGINCTNCHGRIEDHALSLLAAQKNIKQAEVLAKNLEPYFAADKASINPRTPWLNEPDCKGCHTNFNINQDGYTGTAFNKWAASFNDLYRNRTDNNGVMCISCHGSTHAVYGAQNIYEKQRDNMQPLQYQDMAGTIGTYNNCAVCHIKTMDVNGHHRNMVNRKDNVAIVK